MLDLLQKSSADLLYLKFNGEVLAEDFINGTALASQLGFSAGSAKNTNTSWLNLEYYGRKLMIPKLSLRTNMTWRQIYQAGLVYGVDGPGLTPLGAPVNQFKIINIAGIDYKVYLLSGTDDDVDPGIVITGSDVRYNIPGYQHGEVQKIFYPLITDSRQNSYTGPKLAGHKQAELGFGGGGSGGFSIWTRSTYGPAPTSRVYIRNPDISSYYRQGETYVDSSFGWKPVLEEI